MNIQTQQIRKVGLNQYIKENGCSVSEKIIEKNEQIQIYEQRQLSDTFSTNFTQNTTFCESIIVGYQNKQPNQQEEEIHQIQQETVEIPYSYQNQLHQFILNTNGKYLVCGKIGNGGHGEITRLFNIQKKQFQVLKLFKHQEFTMSGRDIFQHDHEINIYLEIEKQKIQGNQIAEFQIIKGVRSCFLVIENGVCDLREFLKLKSSWLEAEIITVVESVYMMIFQIHLNRLFHCDLKLENFIINNDGDIQFIDFGCSTFQASEFGQRGWSDRYFLFEILQLQTVTAQEAIAAELYSFLVIFEEIISFQNVNMNVEQLEFLLKQIDEWKKLIQESIFEKEKQIQNIHTHFQQEFLKANDIEVRKRFFNVYVNNLGLINQIKKQQMVQILGNDIDLLGYVSDNQKMEKEFLIIQQMNLENNQKTTHKLDFYINILLTYINSGLVDDKEIVLQIIRKIHQIQINGNDLKFEYLLLVNTLHVAINQPRLKNLRKKYVASMNDEYIKIFLSVLKIEQFKENNSIRKQAIQGLINIYFLIYYTMYLTNDRTDKSIIELGLLIQKEFLNQSNFKIPTYIKYFYTFSNIIEKEFFNPKVFFLFTLINQLISELQNSDASALIEQAFVLSQQLNGTQHSVEYSDLLSFKGKIYQNANNLNEAQVIFEETLQVYQNLLGANHLQVATTLRSLSTIQIKKRSYREAFKLCHQSFELFISNLGKEHPIIPQIFYQLAEIYQRSNALEKAEQALRTSLILSQQFFGVQNIVVMSMLISQAIIQDKLSNPESSLEYRLEALQISKNIYGADNQYNCQHLFNIAKSYIGLQNYQEALQYQFEVIKLSLKYYGESSNHYHKNLSLIGEIYNQMGQNDKAIEYYHLSLQLNEQYEGLSNQNRIKLNTNYSRFQFSILELDKAIQIVLENLELLKIFKDSQILREIQKREKQFLNYVYKRRKQQMDTTAQQNQNDKIDNNLQI